MARRLFAATAAAVGAGVASMGLPLPDGPCRLSWTQQVFGHRGCRFIDHAPENTLHAFEYALNQKATGIELDVRLCKSGELVVFHDAFLSPLFDTEETESLVENKTLDELRAMRFTADRSKRIVMPTLDEAIAYCDERGLKLLIEAKHFSFRRQAECAAALHRTFERHPHLYRDSTVISFNPWLLYHLRWLDSGISTCVLHHGTVISDLAWAPDDHYPIKPLRTIAHLLDPLTEGLLSWVAPAVTGASMVGMPLDRATDAVRARHHSNGRLVYVWGVKGPHEVATFPGVSVSCDDDHHTLLHAPAAPA